MCAVCVPFCFLDWASLVSASGEEVASLFSGICGCSLRGEPQFGQKFKSSAFACRHLSQKINPSPPKALLHDPSIQVVLPGNFFL